MQNQREIIAMTMEKLKRIYRDVSEVARLIEEKVRNMGFRALGDAAITWQVSTAYSNPEGWLYRWFARSFRKNDEAKVVGYCIHLGGYGRSDEELLQRIGVSLPFVNVSLLESFEKAVSTLPRPQIYDALWGAGWYVADKNWLKREKVTDYLVYGQVNIGGQEVRTVTYFVDLLSLTDGDVVTRLIVEPMAKMYDGESDWVSKAGLPVIRLAS